MKTRTMRARTTGLLLLGLILGIAMAGLAPTPVRAATVPFHVYGHTSDGWGTSASSQTNPGPTLTVNAGDRVNLTLHSVDGVLHNWFLDLNNDGNWDQGEPASDDFQGTAVVQFEFLAPGAGTYTYRCEYHPTAMRGSLVVQGTGGGPAPSGDNTLLYAGIGVVAAVVVVAAALMLRKKA